MSTDLRLVVDTGDLEWTGRPGRYVLRAGFYDSADRSRLQRQSRKRGCLIRTSKVDGRMTIDVDPGR